jgi:hypothetical protein
MEVPCKEVYTIFKFSLASFGVLKLALSTVDFANASSIAISIYSIKFSLASNLISL